MLLIIVAVCVAAIERAAAVTSQETLCL
jgi:hypothetical protein